MQLDDPNESYEVVPLDPVRKNRDQGRQEIQDRSPRTQPREDDLMANKSQGTWYVSFGLPPGTRSHTRATETFLNEQEAKKFARAKLAETLYVNAGTINPHMPKRTLASTRMLEWLEELDEDDLA
jgi:hypothetical protein